jgi:hypothetical protein
MTRIIAKERESAPVSDDLREAIAPHGAIRGHPPHPRHPRFKPVPSQQLCDEPEQQIPACGENDGVEWTVRRIGFGPAL